MYLDASALVKLVAREPETDALRSWLGTRPVRLTSIVGRIELLRAARRVAAEVGAKEVVERAAAVLGTCTVVALSAPSAETAASLAPAALRTLDAIHVATALSAAPLEAVVAYDERLAEAARGAGLVVAQPGR